MISNLARAVIEDRTAKGVPWNLVILVTGSRDWTHRRITHAVLDGLLKPYAPDDVLLVHGNARGLDTMADEWAFRRDVYAAPFPADWDGCGKAAGGIRNQEMVNYVALQPRHVCVAFKDSFDHTLQRGGTEDCVKRAKAAGIHTYIVEGMP